MAGALTSFCVMAVSVRQLAGTFSIFEILTTRSSVGLAVIVAIGLIRPSLWSSVTFKRLPLHLLRNGSHFIAQYLWSMALTLLPLAIVFALEFTAPVWTALLAITLLGESLTRNRLAAIACGIVGVVIILRPGFAAFQPAALLVLVAAIGFAIVNITTKKLAATETAFAVVFLMNVIQLPLGYIGSDALFFLRIDSSHILGIAGVGIASVTAHFCITNALAAGDATVVVPIDYLRLPLIALVGWMFYGESLDVLTLVGGAIIVAGVLWNLQSDVRRGVVPAPNPAP